MEKKTSKNNILLAIMGVLILTEIVIGFITLQNPFFDILGMIPLFFIALYGFWFYKKPHGNMLKYAMILLAISEIMTSLVCVKNGWNFERQTFKIFAAAALIYAAGRLNRIDQNKYILPLVFVVQFACDALAVIDFSPLYSPIYFIAWFSGTISAAALLIAYFVRYKEHKEAGLSDAPKEKK